jgi:hypothetical protein
MKYPPPLVARDIERPQHTGKMTSVCEAYHAVGTA